MYVWRVPVQSRVVHVHSAADPLVHTLLTTKWHRFARLGMALQAGLYLVLVVLQTFLAWLHSDAVSLGGLQP